jgi:hypothetical protein
MSDWNEGYVTEVEYTYGYYKEMSPAAMRFALLAAGYESPPIDKFTYCELGYGQGAGFNLMAAANPQGDFWGTDFNPAHAAGAEQLARESGLSNVHVFDDSFEDFGKRELPKFDYIGLHGIYSWVNQRNCEQIVRFIDRQLKVGGAVYISYNTLPGWTHAVPLRGLLSQYVEYQTAAADPMNKKLDGALKMLVDLNEIPGSYFKQTPQLADRIKALQAQNRKYIAHEYLNKNWRPLYFSQVVDDLAEAKLTFAAHANPLNCVDALNHTKELQAVLEQIQDPIFREVVRDMGINQAFRRDIFVRGPRRLSRHDQIGALFDTAYVLTQERANCSMKIKTTVGEAALQASFYEPVLDALVDGPKTGRKLLEMGLITEGNAAQRLLQVLVVLVGANYVQPCVPPSVVPVAAKSAARFNSVIIDRVARGSDMEFNYLAAPRIGSGVSLSRLNQLIARSLIAQPKADTAAHVRNVHAVLRSLGQGLVKDGKAIEGEQATLQEIEQRLGDWHRGLGAIGKHLGLIA